MREKGQDRSQNIETAEASYKGMNHALETSRRLAAAQEIAQLGYWEYLPKERVIFWSEQLYHIVEKDSSNFQPRPDTLHEYIHPEDRGNYVQTHRDAISAGDDYILEYKIKLPSGVLKWLSESGRVVHDESRELVRLEGTLQDITKRKKEQEELYLQRERERRILDSQTNYIIRTDLKGNYTYINQKYKDDFGWVFGADGLLGQSAFDTVLECHHVRLMGLIQEVLRTDSITRIELGELPTHGSADGLGFGSQHSY